MHMVWKGGRCRSVKLWMEHISGRRVGWILQALRDVDELADSLEFMRSFFENAPFWYAHVRLLTRCLCVCMCD